MDPPFPQHLRYEEAENLKVGDHIDHCDGVGRFLPAIIEEKIQSSLKIHYIGWSRKWDVICSYKQELHRFAREGSISKRAAHRLKYLRDDDFLDVNPVSHRGWKKGIIGRMDNHSGQIQVSYQFEGKNYSRWMHLDDVNQCDILRTHTKQKADDDMLNRLTSYFETRHTLTNTSDHIKSQSLKEIAEETFNGIPNMIDFIVKHCNISQSQNIQKILNQKNIEYEESLKLIENTQNNDERMEIDIDNNDETSIEQKPKISLLTQLSRDVIGYISGYLSRGDIALFKVTSYKICIVCLKEMKKYNVGVFNVNALINDTKKKYIDFIGFKSSHHLTYSRCIQSTPYSHIFDEWQQIYNIPKQYQLLMNIKYVRSHFYKPQDIEDLLIWQLYNRNFYLLDTRNIITLTNEYDSAQIMKDNTENVHKKCLIFLKWFDIYSQKITPLQLIIIDSNPLKMITYDRLAKYIKDEFIATTKQQKAWHQKVISYVNEMNPKQYQNSYTMHREKSDDRNRSIMEINASYISKLISITNGMATLIFSLNAHHPSLTNSKFATLAEKYQLIKK